MIIEQDLPNSPTSQYRGTHEIIHGVLSLSECLFLFVETSLAGRLEKVAAILRLQSMSGDGQKVNLTFDFLCSLKRGRVVILLAGRRAGKKAIIVKQIDEGKKKRKFGHALVVGIERPARKVTSSMSKKKLTRRATIKPFVKYVNNTHLLATRFIVKEDKDFEFRNSITEDQLENPTTRKELLKSIKTKLQTR